MRSGIPAQVGPFANDRPGNTPTGRLRLLDEEWTRSVDGSDSHPRCGISSGTSERRAGYQIMSRRTGVGHVGVLSWLNVEVAPLHFSLDPIASEFLGGL